jgi:hypothetical protein
VDQGEQRRATTQVVEQARTDGPEGRHVDSDEQEGGTR